MNASDTAFVMACSALVLVMTPGLAIFYGGLTRSKNVRSTTMHSLFLMGPASVLWVIYAYSLCFGNDVGGVIGGLNYFLADGVGVKPLEGQTIPQSLHLTFQMMFVIITPALISGAFAEKMKFTSFVVFMILWITLVYAPICHWVWGGGWLQKMGCPDFAGDRRVSHDYLLRCRYHRHSVRAQGSDGPPGRLPRGRERGGYDRARRGRVQLLTFCGP